jgi:hypothetical protein
MKKEEKKIGVERNPDVLSTWYQKHSNTFCPPPSLFGLPHPTRALFDASWPQTRVATIKEPKVLSSPLNCN